MMNNLECESILFPREEDWIDSWIESEDRLTPDDNPGFGVSMEIFKLSDFHNIRVTTETLSLDDLMASQPDDEEDELLENEPGFSWTGNMRLSEFTQRGEFQPVQRLIKIQLDNKDDQTEHISITVDFRDDDRLKKFTKRHRDRVIKAYKSYEADLEQNAGDTPLIYDGYPEYGHITLSIVADDDVNDSIALCFVADFIDTAESPMQSWDRAMYLHAVLDAFERVYPRVQKFIDGFPVT
jgi:hypothetical protein